MLWSVNCLVVLRCIGSSYLLSSTMALNAIMEFLAHFLVELRFPWVCYTFLFRIKIQHTISRVIHMFILLPHERIKTKKTAYGVSCKRHSRNAKVIKMAHWNGFSVLSLHLFPIIHGYPYRNVCNLPAPTWHQQGVVSHCGSYGKRCSCDHVWIFA